jgi:uncharacterized membrane protein SpoIIM required for sporulation
MREGMFIKKNVDKWNEYQHSKTNNPDETAERFVTLIDDLAYAKTFYPKSKVTKWINGIAAGIYQNIYTNRKEKYTRIFFFWKRDLPLLFKKYHKILLFTFLVFTTIVLIAIFSSIKDPSFVRGVLGDNYVDQTEDNISKGDPFGIYRDENPFSMFVRIAMNNIFIAVLMVAGGLTLGIFTLNSIWNNALMLGTFQYMFFSHGLGMQSIMVIWIHGTIEILSCIIAATAGFVIANSILFPKTFSRKISFQRGVSDALKIMIVLVPLFIIAAFLETYVTHLMSNTYNKRHHGGLPVWCSVLILIGSLTFIVWYFIIYPIRLHKRELLLRSESLVHSLPDTE